MECPLRLETSCTRRRTGLGLVCSISLTWMTVGAALFLISDLILAAQLFNDLHFRGVGDVVWLTYGPGQMLIVYSVTLGKLF